MPVRILIILAAVVGLYIAYRRFLKLPPKTRLQAAAVTLGILFIALAATGRLNWVFALVGALLPFARRLLLLLGYLPFIQRIYRQFKSGQAGQQPSAGQQSIVETRFLRMTLDHDTGEMNGNVLEGAFTGKSLHQLTLDQLLELLTECTREDAESAQLLRAYLGRVHGDEWQQSEADPQAAEAAGGMTHREAYEILGLEESAGEEEIRAAHRSLMQKLHPDRGGSTYLASKINQAKDVLLGKQQAH